jgi:transcriptional regulator of arginine metabolism
MANKASRHAAILEVTGSRAVASQEELRQQLKRRGIQVTQATLSRDLRELGLVRVPSDAGARYVRQGALSDEAKPSLAALLPQLFASISAVSELVVLHTVASGAQPISEAIDAEGWPEILGTIAGENTILIVCRSGAARQAVVSRLTGLARRG